MVREILDTTPIDGIRPTGGGPTELRPTTTAASATSGATTPTGA